jgi:hypothetical protein
VLRGDVPKAVATPLVLLSGRRLFAEGTSMATLKLVDTRTTTTGVVIATYRPS